MFDHYVYAHLNPVTLKPFYIGKGIGKRLVDTKNRSALWNSFANKYGFVAIKLIDGVQNEVACEIEKQYIGKLGFFKTGGSLVNLTSGGEGGNTFDPIGGKNWNSGKTGIYSEETLSKMRSARLGKKLSPEVRMKVLEGLKKAAEKSLRVRTSKVRCLVTGKIWENRNECMKELGLNLKVYEQRILRNLPIKGNHLQLIKINQIGKL